MEQSWLQLEPDGTGGRCSFPVVSNLTGSKGHLFGGCAVAAVVEHLGAESGRPVAWVTCQFSSPIVLDDLVSIQIDNQRQGRRLTQVSGTATVRGERCMSFLGAAGGWDSPSRIATHAMPEVPGPSAMIELDWDPGDGGLNDTVEVRGQHSADDTNGSRRIWLRFRDLVPGDLQRVAVAADFLAPAISGTLGRQVYAASLDNTVRFSGRSDSEWLLVELWLDGLVDGIAHGTSHVWAEDGQLLGIGSQTCAVIDLDDR